MKVMAFIVIILMFATLLVLISGVALMMKGGKVNQKYSNKLMVARVTLQALTIAAIFLMFLMK